MLTGKLLFAALAVIPVIADLLSTLASPVDFWAPFLQSLYYPAIVIGGLTFGWKAGLALACIAGFCHPIISYFVVGSPWMRVEGQVLAFLVVGFAFIEERRRATKRMELRTAEGGLGFIDSRSYAEQLSELTAEILHQIRTPLASIEGSIFLLKENVSDIGNPAEFMDIIARECSRVRSVLDEIAACAEMLPLTCEATEVESILSEAVRLSALEVPDPSISLRTEIAANLPLVWCDRKQILEVLVSFVAGTMRAMHGGGEVLLAAERVDGQARIRLSVLDQTIRAVDPAAGRGPFSSTFDPSSGLRLLAARRTLLQHGGSVKIASLGHLKKLQFITLPLYK
jgi:signal transduction histidine kinase